ncbi:ribonuclease HI [Methylobacterium sp. ID0610]|uniref:ribonuclease HI n=1 Tax=Methylobacterium carpenticola TaxID=3344827 RepID=UPI00368B76BD
MDGTTKAPARRITIAFDGACKGNPGKGGFAAILINEATGRERIVKGHSAGPTTNNQMELSAAIAGLRALRPGAYVTMVGDSQYVVRGFTEWLPGWKAKGWKTGGGKPVQNVELWKVLGEAVSRHAEVRWTWTKGHAGDELNERVDEIASGEAGRGVRLTHANPRQVASSAKLPHSGKNL